MPSIRDLGDLGPSLLTQQSVDPGHHTLRGNQTPTHQISSELHHAHLAVEPSVPQKIDIDYIDINYIDAMNVCIYAINVWIYAINDMKWE